MEEKAQFSRLQTLIGAPDMQRLYEARVAVFGVGGVGGHCALSLARCGIGAIDIIDYDRVDITNINRQAVAYLSTVGRYKADVMREMILDINESARVEAIKLFYGPNTADALALEAYDYIVDAMDNVTAKLTLITRSKELGVNIISSMGTGNKLNPSMLELADIYETSMCPLARVMRRELRKRGVNELKVLYSKEEPIKHEGAQRTPASCAFVPGAAGLMLAGEAVKGIIGSEKECSDLPSTKL